MNELQFENLMRGLVARFGQLLEVIVTSMTFNVLAVGMGLYGIHLAATIRTPEAVRFAPYVIAGSVVMAAKGGFMLHRKWDEYGVAEKTSQAQAGAWINPSVNVSPDSRKSVLIVNILAVATLALPVLVYCYYQIVITTPSLPWAMLQILPSLAITLVALWAWMGASK